MRARAMILVSVALTAQHPAAAQRREASGLWYTVGVAPAWARVTCDICRPPEDGPLRIPRRWRQYQPGGARRRRARRLASARRRSNPDLDVGWCRRLLVSERGAAIVPAGWRHAGDAPRQRRHRRRHVVGNRPAARHRLRVSGESRLAACAVCPLLDGSVRRRREVQWRPGRRERDRKLLSGGRGAYAPNVQSSVIIGHCSLDIDQWTLITGHSAG